MKVYAPPTEIAQPDFNPWDTYDARCDEYRSALRAWTRDLARRRNKQPHRLVGKVIHIPWADGAAEYMIVSGTELVHVPLGDAWLVPDYMVRGLKVADLEEMAV